MFLAKVIKNHQTAKLYRIKSKAYPIGEALSWGEAFIS